MDDLEMIKIAKMAMAHDMDFETLKYSDYLYGQEGYAEDVWEYVAICCSIGEKAFYEMYP